MSDLEKRVEALRAQVKAMGSGAKIFQEWLMKKLDALLSPREESPPHGIPERLRESLSDLADAAALMLKYYRDAPKGNVKLLSRMLERARSVLGESQQVAAPADALREAVHCPFCGEEPKFIADDSYGVEHVLCVSCDIGFSGPAGSGSASHWWNRRSSPVEPGLLHEYLSASRDPGSSSERMVEAKAEAGGPGIGELLHQIEMALEDWKQHGLRGRRSAAQWIINKVMDAIIRPAPAANTEGLRAWRDLTPAERKEWNDGVMDPEAGRHTFQSFDHAYRLIVGREMPRTQQGDAALRGTGEGK